MISYRDRTQLEIGRHYEMVAGCLFDILVENYVNHKSQAAVNAFRQLSEKECRNAQYRLGVKRNASEINQIKKDYLRGVIG